MLVEWIVLAFGKVLFRRLRMPSQISAGIECNSPLLRLALVSQQEFNEMNSIIILIYRLSVLTTDMLDFFALVSSSKSAVTTYKRLH